MFNYERFRSSVMENEQLMYLLARFLFCFCKYCLYLEIFPRDSFHAISFVCGYCYYHAENDENFHESHVFCKFLPHHQKMRRKTMKKCQIYYLT